MVRSGFVFIPFSSERLIRYLQSQIPSEAANLLINIRRDHLKLRKKKPLY